MTTNLEKFQTATKSIKDAARSYVVREYGRLPDTLWEIGGAGQDYSPQEWAVDMVSCMLPKGMYFQKRPSREQVLEMQRFAVEAIDPNKIRIHLIKVESNIGKISRAIPLDEIVKETRWSISREAVERRAAELREIYVAKEGQFNCRYCRKATDDKHKIRETIIARQYPNMRATFEYCSNRCASHHQMAHEG